MKPSADHHKAGPVSTKYSPQVTVLLVFVKLRHAIQVGMFFFVTPFRFIRIGAYSFVFFHALDVGLHELCTGKGCLNGIAHCGCVSVGRRQQSRCVLGTAAVPPGSGIYSRSIPALSWAQKSKNPNAQIFGSPDDNLN